MKVYVISLRSSVDRRQHIKNSFGKLGIEFEFFDAIDGKQINRNSDDRVYKGETFILKNNFFSKTTVVGKLNDGELGCSLSHLLLYEKIVKENLTGAIICEDDLVSKCNFIELINKILQQCKDAQLIHPCTHPYQGLRQGWFNKKRSVFVDGVKYQYFRAGIPGLDWFFNRRRRVSNTSCYYISRTGAKRLLDIGYPVRMEADRLTGMVAYNHLKIYLIDPLIGGWLKIKSDIGSDRHQRAL